MPLLKNVLRHIKFSTVFLVCAVIVTGCSSTAPRPQAKAAIATAHPLATQAGFDVLAQGGNAFDAAVAVSAVLAVVEPAGSGLGGGGFWLLHREHDQHQVMIDGREMAPGAAHRDMYLDETGRADPALSLDGPLAAAIPGLPAALDHINQRYGKLSLRQNLAAAISHAKQGFEVSSHYQQRAQFRLNALQDSPAAADIFLVDDAVPPAGHLLKQDDLATTLSLLAEHGRLGFYRGSVADKFIQGVQQAGGIWTHDDLQGYRVKERAVIRTEYQGNTVTSAALPSSGGIVLSSILNQLAQLPLSNATDTQRRHYVVEAMRRAYFDRSRYLGDSDFVTVPDHLTSIDYGRQLAASISADKASDNRQLTALPGEGEDTTHFSIIDQYGNRVAATLSINYPFGSGFVAPGTGVLLNDEMDDFSAQVGVANGYGLVGNEANAIEANKRPLSSMTPTFVENDEQLLVIGTPGGSRIITMVLLGLLDFIQGKDVDAIVAAPRYHHQYVPNAIQLEPTGFSDSEQQALKDLGHELKLLTRQYGNMQAISYDKLTGRLEAASDPRGEGQALVNIVPITP